MRLSATLALLFCATASAQITVDENSTRARLVDNTTSVSLALRNHFGRPVDTRIELDWLSPDGVSQGRATFAFTAGPGASAAEARLPLDGDDNPLFYRLRYRVSADAGNLTAFAAVEGIASFSRIAEHAYRLTAAGVGLARVGRPYELRVLASHPVTLAPVRGVQISLNEKAAGITGEDGTTVIRLTPDQEEWQYGGDLEIEGRLGDLIQEAEASRPALLPDDIRIYTDKPIYQPGQTVHVRLLAFGPDGNVNAKTDYRVEISDSSAALHSAELTTSRFGVAHTDWEIPENAENGQYRITVANSNGETRSLREIEVRRYELPSFRVTTRQDRPFYLAGQNAAVEVRADYLFGKPVAAAKVRISKAEEESALSEGTLDSSGAFRGTLGLSEAFEDLGNARFIDLHYVAYVTDAGTNRTEKKPFDVRLSRGPLHVYVLSQTRAFSWRPLYVTAYTPDGKPAAADVEAIAGERVLGRAKTNRYGLARVVIPPHTPGAVTVRVTSPEGRVEELENIPEYGMEVRLETDRVLYTAGQAVRCRITSRRPDLTATLLAWNKQGDVLFSRQLRLEKGAAQAVIPYDARFGRELSLAVYSPLGETYQTARTVLYPGTGGVRVDAVPARASYRPGEEVSVAVRTASHSGGPVASALGVAVVDESVFERAAADAPNSRRGWFDSFYAGRETRIGGLGANDLANLDPAQIDPDLQLVAEALLASSSPSLSYVETFLEEQHSEYAEEAAKSLAGYAATLDRLYARSLEYPRNQNDLRRMAVRDPGNDPWLRPYRLEFATEETDDVFRAVSAGPDKVAGTEDDIVALTIRRGWFAPAAALIRQTIERQEDYPANTAELERLLAENGIRLDRMKDPWGSSLRTDISHFRDRRIVTIQSPGPDKVFGNQDDCTPAHFTGTYFQEMGGRINRALGEGEIPPDEDRFYARLAAAGIDLRAERDPWGRPYYVTFGSSAQFGERYRTYTYMEYQGIPEERNQVVPTKTRVSYAEIRSVGEDGKRGTYDDVHLARLSRLITDEQRPPEPEAVATSSVGLSGKGTLTGAVTDPSGAAVAGAQVTLNDAYVAETDGEGRYYFRGLPKGKYRLRITSVGFKFSVIDGVPVDPDRITRFDWTLQLGNISETVAVEAPIALLETSTSVAGVAGQTADTPAFTPRLREYFPETLFWAPEVLTGADGRAAIKFKLADAMTTWRVAVIASTEDGRIAETTADIKAFQPFFVDLDPPQVLTMGDEISLPVPIRNYLATAQSVAVSVAAPPIFQLSAQSRRSERIAGNSSANTVLGLRAAGTGDARLRVTAQSSEAADAIEKPFSIHPDGEPVSRSVNGIVESGRLLRIQVPANAIPGTVRAQVKVYPDLLSNVIESMESLLRVPGACAEQTISAAYPNLLFLRALKTSGFQEPRLEQRARRNLETGYRRLLSYRNRDGGFGYWSRSPGDVALTAYAVSFLEDAAGFIATDTRVVEQARAFLSKQTPADAVVHALGLQAMAKAGPAYEALVIGRLGELARSAAEFDDPYPMAVFALAAMDARRPELASTVVERLRGMAQDEQGGAWWSLRRNTPFYGWGRAGAMEATALVVTALSRWQTVNGPDPKLTDLIDRGVVFLLRNKDARGVWLTGQATVRVFKALFQALAGAPNTAGPARLDVLVNGKPAGSIAIPAARNIQAPAVLDISRFIQAGAENELSILSRDERLAAQVQFNAEWYQPWEQPRTSSDFSLKVRYSATDASMNEAIRCEATISRPAFRGYGMMIAEIGLPPGAEVDRGSLSALVEESRGIDSFEVAPDRVTFYVWPRAEDTSLSFTFRPRYPMRARTAPSALYDYYNPEARVTLAPATFSIR